MIVLEFQLNKLQHSNNKKNCLVNKYTHSTIVEWTLIKETGL